MSPISLGHQGEIVLPDEIRERYGFKPDGPIRMIETKTGVLIIPLTNEPMSESLVAELSEWQGAGESSWNLFAFEESSE